MFEKQNLKFRRSNFNKSVDISKVRNHEFSLPLVNAKFGDNGIMYYGREEDFECVEMSIDIVNDGAVSTGSVYAQPQKTGILYNAYLIKLKDCYCANSRKLLWFVASIEKSIKMKFGYENKAGWEKVKKHKIQLPTKNGEIDFDFMDEFVAELEAQRVAELEAQRVAELEAQRVAELEAYLTVTGLKDYILTEEEEKVIQDYLNIDWKEYLVGELFERVSTKKLPYKAKDLPKEPCGEFILPALTSSFMNQGLNYYVPKDEATVLKNVISIPSNSDVYRAYFQSRDFTVLSDAYSVEWIYEDKELNPEQYLFTVPCINKVTDLPIYSYKNKLGGWNVVKKKKIELPTVDGNIDYNYMETLTKAIQKLVIKDVVEWADKKISATKQVIKNKISN